MKTTEHGQCPVEGCENMLHEGAKGVCGEHYLKLPQGIKLRLLFPASREEGLEEALAYYGRPT